MKSIQLLSDKLAIGLSSLCAIHCLAFPLILVSLPTLAALPLDEEAFHLWMLFLVIPISVYALVMGYRLLKHFRLLAFGIVGLLFMISAVALGESLLGEVGEKALTLIGAAIIAFTHYRNYRLCQYQDTCACPE